MREDAHTKKTNAMMMMFQRKKQSKSTEALNRQEYLDRKLNELHESPTANRDESGARCEEHHDSRQEDENNDTNFSSKDAAANDTKVTIQPVVACPKMYDGLSRHSECFERITQGQIVRTERSSGTRSKIFTAQTGCHACKELKFLGYISN